MTTFRESEVKFNPSEYETKQVFYKSKDGTQVPMFLTYKKGLELKGNNPTLLYGYGGFDVSLTPYFSTSRLIWLEAGGVFALANIRGGNEYGEEWHQAGMLENKQNVFDDFIAAGEWLINNKYTSNKKLAINHSPARFLGHCGWTAGRRVYAAETGPLRRCCLPGSGDRYAALS